MGTLIALLCAASWAAGSLSMQGLSKRLDPFSLNAPRTLIGGLSVLIYSLLSGRAPGYSMITAEKLFFMLGSIIVGGGLGDALYVASMARVGASRAFPISSTYPAFALIFGILFLSEPVTLALILGVPLVIGGIILISNGGNGHDVSLNSPEGRQGILYALAAAVLWATAIVLLAPGLDGLDPVVVSSVRTPALSVLLWGVVAMRRSWPKLQALSQRDWWVIGGGGFVGWGLGIILFVISVSMLGAARSAVLTSVSPLFALPLTILIWKEKVTWKVWLGTALAVAGVIVVGAC
jgi:drug/metabolite transporter (DMT)-like permease